MKNNKTTWEKLKNRRIRIHCRSGILVVVGGLLGLSQYAQTLGLGDRFAAGAHSELVVDAMGVALDGPR